MTRRATPESTPTAPFRRLARSQVEASIREAQRAFRRFGLRLPAWSEFTPDRWRKAGPEYDEIRRCQLGWDVTDFGQGRFEEIGRVLFTLRNGSRRHPGYAKSYAQKYLFDPEGQRAPAHYHLSKREDICCLAGGNILVQLTRSTPAGGCSTKPLTVAVDGVAQVLAPGGIVRLRPGMSVCIPPRTIHQFWGEEGTGLTVSSEVSSVCDDWTDNVFLTEVQRFPAIVEDAPQTRYLCHEYPVAPHGA